MAAKMIGRYEIIRELGRGGMAVVYLAQDPQFGRRVAVKVLPAQMSEDPEFLARFHREARTIARLDHPAIVPVYDAGEQEEGGPYLVMRYMAGGTLDGRLARGPMFLQDAAQVIDRVAGGLQAAHSEGIIHRDIKPSNILFDRWEMAYLADFGIARLDDAAVTAMTATGASIGTPAYMSPEVARGEKAGPASDIYALGIVLYEMLSGDQPFDADTPVSLMYQHVHEPVPDVTAATVGLPPGTQEVIERALAKTPADRFQSAAEFARAVDALSGGSPAPPLFTPPEPEQERPASAVEAHAAPQKSPPDSSPAAVESEGEVTELEPAPEQEAPAAVDAAQPAEAMPDVERPSPPAGVDRDQAQAVQKAEESWQIGEFDQPQKDNVTADLPEGEADRGFIGRVPPWVWWAVAAVVGTCSCCAVTTLLGLLQ